jgi:hypothetical protein
MIHYACGAIGVSSYSHVAHRHRMLQPKLQIATVQESRT